MDMGSDDEGAGGAGSRLASFDLMVNRDGTTGAGASGSFFKKTQSFPMFPYNAPKDTVVGPYGAIVDTSIYARGEYMADANDASGHSFTGGANSKQAEPGQTGAGTNPVHGSSMEAPVDASISGMDLEDPLENRTPTKCISWDADVQIRASILSLDYSGRSDGLSMKKIVEHVEPRRLIVVHGNDAETAAMVEYCKAAGIAKEGVMAPAVGESVDLSSQSASHKIVLQDAMTSHLTYQQVDDYQVAYFDAVVAQPDPHGLPILEPNPDAPGHDPIFVGDVQLNTLRQILAAAGYAVEFTVDKVLVCNDKVGIRKLATGEFAVEGVFCDEYFEIRSLVYEQFRQF